MDNRYLFERFEERKAEGMAAFREGKHEDASRLLMEAAEILFRLAARSEGKLRDGRKQNAEKLAGMARNLRDNPPKGPGGKALSSAGAGGGEDDSDRNGDAWQLAEKPSTRFDDIAGLDEVKDAIQLRMILPLQHPDKAKQFGIRPGGGLLLYGPPGTGKTMLARAVAGEIDAPFYSVSPADILSRWVGDAEKNIDKLFSSARKHSLAVIFIDEIEAMLPRRDAVESPVMQRLVPQVLAELEGIDKERQNPLLFIGATNKPWALDEAVLRPGRFDEKVYIPLPDAAARKAILWHHLGDKPIDADLDIDDLVARTEGFSGADIVGLAQRVCGNVFRRAIESPTGADELIRRVDADAVLTKLHPSVTAEMLVRYEKFSAVS
ncbi:MAG: 26S protease regulatory subunit [Planctomycetota bacterium]